MEAEVMGHGVGGQSTALPENPAGVLGEESLTALRAPVVRRLLALRAERRLSREHVRLAGECLGVSERTVWRWLAEASRSPQAAIRPGERSGDRFEVTREIRVLLAYWHGNASAVHRQLVTRAQTGGHDGQPTTTTEPAASPAGAPPAAVPLLGLLPLLVVLCRVMGRDLMPGERAGFAAGRMRCACVRCSWPGCGAGVARCGGWIICGFRCWSLSGAGPAGAVGDLVHRLRDGRDHRCCGYAGGSVAGVGAGRVALRGAA